MALRFFEQLRPEALAALAHLSIGELNPPWPAVSDDEARGTSIADRGWGRLAFSTSDTEPLRVAIEGLHRLDLPALAAFAYDAAWQLGFAAREAVSARLGARYEVLEDFWAFRVAPGSSGWSRHRGVYELLDRAIPQYVNVWIALSDALIDQSCMHFVRLDCDRGYTGGDLHDVRADAGVPAPCAAGTLMYWNANTLHWGGECGAEAAPRVSITFTLVREDAVGAQSICRPSELSPWRRIDAMADQIIAYAESAKVSTDLLAWANASAGLRARLQKRSLT